MDQHPVFVYGTLRPGQGNYRLLAGRTRREVSAVAPGLALFGLGLPYAVPLPGALAAGVLVTIASHLYRDVLADLDHLEGYRAERPGRSHYVRRVLAVRTRDGITHTAWVYLAGPGVDPAGMSRISGDDWLLASSAR